MKLREFYTLIIELNIYGGEKDKSTVQDQMAQAMNDPAITVRK